MIIYKTTNLINDKFYIGKDTKNNPNYLGSGKYLHRAIKKYGIENFKKEILEACIDIKTLNEREKYWIKETNAQKIGYNIADGGTGGKTTPVVWNKGKTYEELFGKEKAKAIKTKLVKSHLGHKQSKETKLKRAAKIRGIKRSEETKNKMSKSQKGNRVSEQAKKKISKTLKKYFKSHPEARKKISESQIGKKLSQEHKNKISISMKKNKKY
jgi:hypothetical protein